MSKVDEAFNDFSSKKTKSSLELAKKHKKSLIVEEVIVKKISNKNNKSTCPEKSEAEI